MEIVQSYLEKNPCYGANMSNADDRYTTFQRRGPLGLVLHSVGCAQPNAMTFVNRWNSTSYNRACVHAFIDANTGIVYQCMPWNFRAWHAGGSANNTHVGVEMCEPSAIKYRGVSAKFDVTDREKALAQCETAYNAAVELFAFLCDKYSLDPLKDGVIISHNEAGKRGIGSGHVDPEHLWNGLGTGFTMDGFRKDVKAAMTGTLQEHPAAPSSKGGITVNVSVLKRGATGSQVKALQALLNGYGFNCGSVDGDFGSKTYTALCKYQNAMGLQVDGSCGPKTWSSLLGV